jgi:tetratricopeptide (TPR) repeat protein
MKQMLKAIIVFTVIIGAVLIASRFFDLGFKRNYRVDTDKHINEIRERIKDIEEDNKRDTASLRRLGEQYSNLGGIYLQKGLWDQAIDSYEKSIHNGRSTHGVLYSLGIAYGNRGRERENEEDFGKSELYLRKAIDMKENFYEAQNALAILLFYHRDGGDEALSIAQEVSSRNPKYYVGRFTLGRLYYEKRAPEKALQVYEDLNADLEKLPPSGIINTYKNQCRENIQRIMTEMAGRKQG